jgi:hypothetical protein
MYVMTIVWAKEINLNDRKSILQQEPYSRQELISRQDHPSAGKGDPAYARGTKYLPYPSFPIPLDMKALMQILVS